MDFGGGRIYLLRAIVRDDLDPLLVVTVYRTSKIALLDCDVKVTYDPEVDVLRIVLSGAPVEESDEEKPGLILDYDKDGNVVGLEVMDASRRVENPRALEYAVTS